MKSIYLLVLLLMLLSCSKSEEDSKIFPPAAAELLFPANHTECIEGEMVDASRSKVNFQWKSAENTTVYELFLKDLEDKLLHQEQTSDTELEIIIERGKTFKWYVESRAESTVEKATSEVWSFYNAGEGVTAHVPFPAELLNPSQGESFPSSTDKVQLEWSGSDLDNDILEYEVYFGKSNPPTHIEQVTSEESFEVDVDSGESYFWYIKTVDENNNSSNSIVSYFHVN